MRHRKSFLLSRRAWLAAMGTLTLSGCGKSPAPPARISGRLRQEAYIWQRLWTPGVSAGLLESTGRVDGLTILAGEIEWNGKSPRFINVNVNHAKLLESKISSVLAVRIGPWGGPFEASQPHTKQIVAWIVQLLEESKRAGWAPPELQIDFDAATSKLEGYRTWLGLIQRAVAPLPVSFTALPDWLNSPVLKTMATAIGRFVLQVHAVERAKPDDKAPSLIDPAKAKKWADQAALLGAPYRIALPTYRSTVGFNAEGKIIGIDSEGPARAWPEGTRVVGYQSPAAELAGLIAGWTADRPQLMEGVVWYRLPVKGEARNWTWKTLEPVMSGRAPVKSLQVLQSGTNPRDLTVENNGEDEMPLPQEISLTFDAPAEFTAGDGLAGYDFVRDAANPQIARLVRPPASPLLILPPGAKKSVGWVRNQSQDGGHELHIQIH